MITRKDIMWNCPEGFEDKLKDIVDEIEGEVNSAKDLLENISGAEDLGNVDECLDKLQEISKALY